MERVKVRDHYILIDIEQELRQHHFDNARWSEYKLISASPFREDNHPSFYVNLKGDYAGMWGDSGAYDERYASGNLPALIANLRRISYSDACDYLIDNYGNYFSVDRSRRRGERIKLPKIVPKKRRTYNTIDSEMIEVVESPYLSSRGLGTDVQERIGTGRNIKHPFTTALPWRHHNTGEIGAIKYRSTVDKKFFYEDGGQGISDLIFGSCEVFGDELVVCEAEIDAMSFMESGVSAVATGSASISNRQVEIIKHLGVSTIIVAGDNDEQGKAFNARMVREFMTSHTIKTLNYGEYNDANDVLVMEDSDVLADLVANANPVRVINIVK